MKLVIAWFRNLLVSIDELANSIFLGDPQETISSRVGKLKRAHNGQLPWHHPIAKSIDLLCDLVDPNHSLDAIDNGVGEDAIIKNPDMKEVNLIAEEVRDEEREK